MTNRIPPALFWAIVCTMLAVIDVPLMAVAAAILLVVAAIQWYQQQ